MSVRQLGTLVVRVRADSDGFLHKMTVLHTVTMQNKTVIYHLKCQFHLLSAGDVLD